MSLIKYSAVACIAAFSLSAFAVEPAKSQKHAVKATELRQSVFSLLGSNMGPLGGMAKGKIAFDAKRIETNALRINQLSLMIADYNRTDTSKFDVKTEALNKIWQDQENFSKRIDDLTKASAHLQKVAASGDKAAIKKAIGGVGKTCGGCHDDFKKD